MDSSFWDYHGDEIAIIGMAGRFPGADDVEEFWSNLRDGVESISFFSDSELAASGVEQALIDNPNYVKARALLKDIELFDAEFFGFNPREAELLDPQQRLFLECAWEALEHAGYDSLTYEGRVGVYAGAGSNTYSVFNLYPNRELLKEVGLYQAMLGSERDYLTTHVSYKLNLRGPSLNVQTACSSSLVAVHLACQSLLGGECQMALAGGVSIRVPQKSGHLYQEGMIFSPDGHCRAFDAKARGTIGGSGVGIVVLKMLADSLVDRDNILAVIKGSAINNDGSLKISFTGPGAKGQANVVKEALTVARVSPHTISYVEAHGTGTDLGDPVEISSLTEAFRVATNEKQFCGIGSVKTNIGHLDAAAGIAGLVKVVQSLKYKMIPPHLHYESPNPQIDFDDSPFFVNSRLCEWQHGTGPRRAGVSSFGIGGTNAHVIVEQAGTVPEDAPAAAWQLFVLSGKSRSALEGRTARLSAFLRETDELNLANVAYTLQVGRSAFDHRRIVLCQNPQDAIVQLDSLDPKRVLTAIVQAKDRPVAFLFPGQGTQYVNMGRGLYDVESAFRAEVELASELLEPHLGLKLCDQLYPAEDTVRHVSGALSQTSLSQPALFVVEYALAKLWIRWGVRPQAMLGHSIGEYVAACLAGVLSLADALKLVAIRGQLMQQLSPGAMLSVQMPEHETLPLLGSDVSLAAVNAPDRCVVSGPFEAIEQLQDRLVERGVRFHRLHTSHAFHSRMMDPIVTTFAEVVAAVELKPPTIAYLSNVTGNWIRAAEATDPQYWAIHLRGPVLFYEGVKRLLAEPHRVMLEGGPGLSLTSLARPRRSSEDQVFCSSLPHPDEEQTDLENILRNVGKLWLAGVSIDWRQFQDNEMRRRVPLPAYPFERRRYWIEPQPEPNLNARHSPPSARQAIQDWFYLPIWKQTGPQSLDGVKRAEGRDGPHVWLLFIDQSGLGEELAEKLKACGNEVVTVVPAESFAPIDACAYGIDPRNVDDYAALAKALVSMGKVPQRIVHLWSVTVQVEGSTGTNNVPDPLDCGFYSLMYLLKAIGQTEAPDEIKIWAVSSDMQRLGGEPSVYPEKATLLGICKVIPQEYARIVCRSIDISTGNLDQKRHRLLINQLLSEVQSESADQPVALRGGRRWIQTLEPIRLDTPPDNQHRLREGGVYLITGGLGGIGLEIAEYLAKKARAKLVLTGRSKFPDRDHWQEWLLAHQNVDGDEENTAGKIRKLIEIESAGAEVAIFAADVANRDQMEQVVKRARAKYGEIHGVIHSAGVPGGGLLQLKTREIAAEVLSPKVTGSRVLESLFKDARLDFFILCSSVNSLTGGPGQADYSAANAFLDSFANYNSFHSETLVVSIDWDAWREVGMARGRSPRGQAAGTVSGTTAHPLFDSLRVESPDRRTFVTEFSTAKHWVLDEHRIAGNPVVPGTAYLEMARAALEPRPRGRQVELHDVMFVTPLRVPDGEKTEVHTVVQKEGDGFSFSVKSRAAPTNGRGITWQAHAMGRVRYADFGTPIRHDLHRIIRRCNEKLITTPEEWPVDDGPRWRSLLRVHVGRGEMVAVLELPERYSDDLNEFGLHPALLDMATGMPKRYLGYGIEYLPFSYKRLSMRGPLAGSIYAYARLRDDQDGNQDRNQETMTFDLQIMNHAGIELVEIEEFTAKRVNDAHARLREWGELQVPHRSDYDHAATTGERLGTSQPGLQPDDASGSPPLSEGFSAAEGILVFDRVLSRNLAPQIVVCPHDINQVIEQARVLTTIEASNWLVDLIDSTPIAAHPRPELLTSYEPPASPAEELLAEVWQSVLGIQQIGINDNFFEMGGDSMAAIQVISRAKERGLAITPRHLFQHQTIAELAGVAIANQREREEVRATASMQARTSTPSDFPLAKLNEEKLKKLSLLIDKHDA
jgi:acyl transferase domain-containing protein